MKSFSFVIFFPKFNESFFGNLLGIRYSNRLSSWDMLICPINCVWIARVRWKGKWSFCVSVAGWSERCVQGVTSVCFEGESQNSERVWLAVRMYRLRSSLFCLQTRRKNNRPLQAKVITFTQRSSLDNRDPRTANTQMRA